jgi:hypothetical protein
LAQTVIDDQRKSLDAWIDYLASDDAKYPDELKYWAFRSILKMGRFDKDKRKFTNREGKGSVSPFPELNRESLAVLLEDMEKKVTGDTNYSFTSRYDIEEENKTTYKQALEKDRFSKAYALAIDAFKPISENLLKETRGEWREYPKGSDPTPLVQSISDYGTGWCLKGEPTARRYLESNDLHIYYSNDKDGNPAVPRCVMVINQANHITEVRGIEAHEHLDSHINDIVEAHLKEHPDGEKYKKKSQDMKRLTEIEYKAKKDQHLTKEDLLFLYEVDSTIEGFGYESAGRDPRIEEIRSQRNPKEDLPILFDCREYQIALSPKEIAEYTVAYIGKLEPGILTLLEQYNIEHIYTSFPEGKIRRESLEIGGRTPKELEKAINDHPDMDMSSYSRSMMHHKKFTTLDNLETIHLVLLRVRDLGFTSAPTTTELFKRAEELGFELCPAETGPVYRLSHPDQPMNDWFYVGMDPILASVGRPDVFYVDHGERGLWLYDSWTEPDHHWPLDYQFVFRLRKSDT